MPWDLTWHWMASISESLSVALLIFCQLFYVKRDLKGFSFLSCQMGVAVKPNWGDLLADVVSASCSHQGTITGLCLLLETEKEITHTRLGVLTVNIILENSTWGRGCGSFGRGLA